MKISVDLYVYLSWYSRQGTMAEFSLKKGTTRKKSLGTTDIHNAVQRIVTY